MIMGLRGGEMGQYSLVQIEGGNWSLASGTLETRL